MRPDTNGHAAGTQSGKNPGPETYEGWAVRSGQAGSPSTSSGSTSTPTSPAYSGGHVHAATGSGRRPRAESNGGSGAAWDGSSGQRPGAGGTPFGASAGPAYEGSAQDGAASGGPEQGRSAGFDVAALLAANPPEAMFDLHAKHINPAIVGVLKTIGFDTKYTAGRGAYLFDDQGRRYIDCLGGYAVFACGRNHPTIRAALQQAMDLDLPNLPGVGIFRVAGLLAAELVKMAPGDLPKVFFASGGAEAIDSAIKMARIATGRERVVYCHRSYHGLTMGALSVTGNHEFREGFGPMLATDEIPFNDLAALEATLRATNPAAFIVEPIQGKGVNLPKPGYLKGAAELCKKYGTLLIVDEIQTGFGRTGKWFACQHDGGGTEWQPDILVVAKALSGGAVPTSAVLCREWIHQRVFPSMNHCSRIQNTFSMNDLSMVAGLATLHVMREERIVENSADVGDYLLAGLRALIPKYSMLKDVRGRGLMIAMEFGRPDSMMLKVGWDLLHKADPSLFCQSMIMPLMSEHRILAQVAGHRLDVIKLIPALVLSKQDADEVIAAMDKVIGAIHKFPGPAWEVGTKLTAAAMRRLT